MQRHVEAVRGLHLNLVERRIPGKRIHQVNALDFFANGVHAVLLAQPLKELILRDPVLDAVGISHLVGGSGRSAPTIRDEASSRFSRITGDAIRLSSNRRYLARAINLGFREVLLNSADSPVLCQDERRRYVWALLGKEGVIEPSDDEIVTASPLASQTTPIPVPRVKTVNDTTSAPTPAKSSARRALPSESANTNCSLEQAIGLRDSLRNAAAAAHQLVRSLKQQKRESRIVASTLASLEQLQKLAS